ncbi:MAG: hypothetical protein IKN74_01420 [Clostridia bacterium]|nr:hypothetical protein [Clostridia bacterium]
MKLTEEEKEYFRTEDDEIFNYISAYTEEGIIQSLFNDDELVRVTHAFLKKIVVKVAENRGIEFDPEDKYDLDEVLRNMIHMDEEDKELFEGFDAAFYKDENALKTYLENKVKDASPEDVEHISLFFGFLTDDFRKYLVDKTTYIRNNIDRIYEECGDEREEKEDSGISFSDEDWEDWEDTEERDYDEDSGPVIIPIEDDDIVWDDDGWEDDEFDSPTQEEPKPEPIKDEQIVDLIKYFNTYSDIAKARENGVMMSRVLRDISDEKKVESFLSNPDLKKDLENFVDHDKKKHMYLFHGTQALDQADSILKQGFGMMQNDLTSTTYQEFSIRDIILYHRGFGGEIGRDAIVVIDRPIEDRKLKEIVQPKPKDKKIDFSQSGLQGLNGKANFYVDTKYVIGYVNKRDKKVILNPRYYDYDKLSEKMGRKIDNHLHEDDDAR